MTQIEPLGASAPLPLIRTGPATFVELLRRHAADTPDRPALTYLRDGESAAQALTFGELDERARGVAAALQDLGAAGQRALLLHTHAPDFIAAFFGCLYAGVIAVPLFPPHPNRPARTLPKIRAVAADCDAALALTTAAGLASGRAMADLAPELGTLRWLATDATPSGSAGRWREPDLGGEALALLQYTSGSTATPKGVMVSHRNLLHNTRMTSTAFETDRDSTLVTWLPLFHDMGLVGTVLLPLYNGAQTVVIPPLAFLQQPFRWLRAISEFGGQVSGGPNFGYELCLRKVTDEQRAALDLRGWRIAFNGAEPVRARTIEAFARAFAPCGFRPADWYPCYGMAEATLFASGGRASAEPIIRAFDECALEQHRVVPVPPGQGRSLVGCGRAWQDRRIAIVDPETGRRVPPERVGEIWLAGADLAAGYWGRPDESERTCRARLADSDDGPFLRTGDLGFLRDGELFITGRLKDLIIVDGRNHYPQDIELTVEQCHPALRAGCSAAFSVEAAGREQVVVVAEVERDHLSAGARGSTAVAPQLETVPRAIRQAVAENHDLRVHDVVLVRPMTIPKTSSGKLQRLACRASLLAGQFVDAIVAHSTLDTPPADGNRGGPCATGGRGRPPTGEVAHRVELR